jgi:diguanylate cyclase (GGDEF)-like protein
MGDLVLQQFAALLQSHIRPGVDWLARYGGEEFVLVLPETDLSGCHTVAERLRRLVSENQIVTPAGAISITASFGVTGLAAGGQESPLAMENLLAEADHFMYQAKAAGRNRVAGPPITNGLTNIWTVGAHGK